MLTAPFADVRFTDDDGVACTDVERIHLWVSACALAAREMGQILLEKDRRRSSGHLRPAMHVADREHWRRFLCLLQHDATRDAIEVAARTVSLEAASQLAGVAFRRYLEKLENALVIQQLEIRQRGRQARLEGRIERMSDEDWEKRASPPKPKMR